MIPVHEEQAKRLLDVVTVECSAVVLKAAELRPQSMGLRTVGRGPSSADCAEAQESNLLLDIDNFATAVQHLARRAILFLLIAFMPQL